MDMILPLVLLVGMVWFSGYAFAKIIGIDKRYVLYTKKVNRFTLKQALTFRAWVWKHYHVQIVWAAIGIVLGILFMV